MAHKVTFDSTGGSAVDTQLVGDGEKASAPANPTRTGYTFVGWRTDATGGVAYDFNTAPGDRRPDAVRPVDAEHIHRDLQFERRNARHFGNRGIRANRDETDDPTLDGKVFVGWTTDAAGTRPYGFGTPVTGELTLYAKWADGGETYHTVTLNLKEGTDYPSTALQSMTLFVKDGEKLAIPDPGTHP